MPEINLSDNRGRDAVVSAESVTVSSEVRWIDSSGAQVGSRKILRSTVPHDLDALVAKFGDDPDALTEALIQSNPEIDMESFGSYLEDTSRVYVDPENNIVHKVTLYEVIRTPEGDVKERRPKKSQEPNVATELPLKWTGKKFKKSDIYRRFVFSGKMQISHINGLTYDFLFDMAKQLETENCMMLIAGGAKGNQPLLFRRGGLAYRGFLEGRTQGNKYALILHLTNMELKAVERPEAQPEEESSPTQEQPKSEPKPSAPDPDSVVMKDKDDTTKGAAKKKVAKKTAAKKVAAKKTAKKKVAANKPADKATTTTKKKATTAKKAAAKKTAKKKTPKKK